MKRWVGLLLLLPASGVWGCAGRGEGVPLADPARAASTLLEREVPAGPYRVEFTWAYADERGPVEGEGVLRYNPPDSLRLDLFGPGEGSMAVALTGSRLESVGQIQDVRLPSLPFLYATAGIFRPGEGRLERGFRADGGRVLVYRTGRKTERRFLFREGRVQQVVERRGGEVRRRLAVRWKAGEPWPASAEFRDVADGRRARWTRTAAEAVRHRFQSDIYALP